VLNSRSERSGDAWPLVLDGRDLLREFGLQAFFFCLFTQSSEVSNSRSVRSGDTWPLDLDGQYLLQEFGLRAFRSPLLTQLLFSFSQSTRSPDMCPLLKDQWPRAINVMNIVKNIVNVSSIA
jgi:hypothetical protein